MNKPESIKNEEAQIKFLEDMFQKSILIFNSWSKKKIYIFYLLLVSTN